MLNFRCMYHELCDMKCVKWMLGVCVCVCVCNKGLSAHAKVRIGFALCRTCDLAPRLNNAVLTLRIDI